MHEGRIRCAHRRAAALLSPSILIVLGACGGVPPTPLQFAAHLPPSVELTDANRAEVAELVAKAKVALAAGDLDRTETDALRALLLDPRHALARALLGHCWMKRAEREDPPAHGDWQRAEGQLLLASRIAPNDPEVALLRAEIYSRDRHLSAAVEVLEAVRQIHRSHVPLLRELSRLRFELGEERAALSVLADLSAALGGADAETQYRIAWCQARIAVARPDRNERQKAYLQAAESYALYLTMRAGDVDGLLGEAHARFEAAIANPQSVDAEQLARSLLLYGQAMRLAPERAEGFYGAAVLREQRGEDGDAATARDLYRRAILLDPGHAGARLNLIANLAATGEIEEARLHAQRVLRLPLSGRELDLLQRWLATPPEPVSEPVRRP